MKIGIPLKNYHGLDPKGDNLNFVDTAEPENKAKWDSRIIKDGDTLEGLNLSQKLAHTTILSGLKNLKFISCNTHNVEIDPTWKRVRGGGWNHHVDIPQRVDLVSQNRIPGIIDNIQELIVEKGRAGWDTIKDAFKV